MAEKSLYERLGGIFAVAAVVDAFSDQLLTNPKIVNANPALKEWHTAKFRERMPGLKFLRTLWVASVAGGPFQYTGEALRDAHRDLQITPEVFDEVVAELGKTLDHFKVPQREKEEVLAAFNGQRPDVTAGAKVASTPLTK
jgi:hemoglobin